MNYLSLSNYREWLESKITFSFSSRKSSAPAKPKKSEAEIRADANRDRSLRKEQFNEKKNMSSGKRRRRGRALLMYNKNEKGVSDKLG
jgi:hypothetical protein